MLRCALPACLCKLLRLPCDLFIALSLFLLTPLALASSVKPYGAQPEASAAADYQPQSKIKACAAYRRRDGSWSKNYKVQGKILLGSTLNAQLNEQRFFEQQNYFLITWKNGGYSALALSNSATAFKSPLLTTDQKDKTWHVSLGWNDCKGFFSPQGHAQSLSLSQASFYPIDKSGKIKGCATYQRKDGSWSKNYKVLGELLSGSAVQHKLQNDSSFFSSTAAQDFSLLNPQSKYFLIQWKNSGYSALKVDPTQLFDKSNLLKDQQGKTWTLSSGWDDCSNSLF